MSNPHNDIMANICIQMSNPHNDIIRETLSHEVEDMKVKEIFDLIDSDPSLGDHSEFAKMIANIIEHKVQKLP